MTDLHTAEISVTVNVVEHALPVQHHWSSLAVPREVPEVTEAKRG